MSTSSIPELTLNITPFGDRVVVALIDKEEVTDSGIVIPDTVKDKDSLKGIVVALGDGVGAKDLVDPRKYLKVGDQVMIGRYSGNEAQIRNKSGKAVSIRVLEFSSILGLVS